MKNINDENRNAILIHYSPYSFLNTLDSRVLLEKTVFEPININLLGGETQNYTIEINNCAFEFLVKFLKWDTDYFKIPTYKLQLVLFTDDDYSNLKQACKEFTRIFFNEKKYCFSEIPSEDIKVIQALNEAGFKLVENRLTYYLDLKNFSYQRFETRRANLNDTENLKRVAREMRNPYDRFHSDNVYDPQIADEFLATYIEESLKGFADYTIVPNGDGVEPDAFVTAKYLIDQWPLINEKISLMVLSAVSSKTCKGWYVKLISEMAYHLKEQGAHYAFMHPATTNRAVIHSYEKLGCKYGKCVHVLSYLS